MKHAIGLMAVLALALPGCTGLKIPFFGGDRDRPVAQTPGADTPRPAARPGSTPPPPGADSAEAFDTTSSAERSAAAATPTAPDRLLGKTVASLGDPADPGFWALTPLVDRPQPGRLVYAATGKGVLVDLRPRAAAAGAGTQVSLAALRVLGVPLTALTELTVYARAP
ncbi:hypothetical protein [Rhodovulum adriaticum]|uniref:D-galactarate dehydratase n=1 Tax=Rhodovulum adriaticum TaxID=35804 RepID=A0A4R2NVV7_RHOAD|nr:hypothetical protein [Rhodovulum adriaticum]MBK1636262.1 hypothetical protein [Rhodovulum adriaticum]TCP26263.1 hypothetical protein EV656_102226 [Rhodovulum adriaticum]